MSERPVMPEVPEEIEDLLWVSGEHETMWPSDHNKSIIEALRRGIEIGRKRIASLTAEVEALKKRTPISEVVKRLEGAFIVSGLGGSGVDWDEMIQIFRKEAQAQISMAVLASERYDRILQLEREAIESSGEIEALKTGLRVTRDERDAVMTKLEALKIRRCPDCGWIAGERGNEAHK